MCRNKSFELPVVIFLLVAMILSPGLVAKADAPVAPTLVSPANNAVLSVTSEQPTVYLQWNSVVGATSYTLEVSEVSDFSTLVFSATGSTSYWLSPQLELGVRYYWRVRSVNNDGVSPWSAVYNFEFIPKAPVLVSPTSCNCCLRPGMINLRWYSYLPDRTEVQLSSYNSFVNPLFSVIVTPHSYVNGRYYYSFSTYLGIGTYYWRARVISGNGTYSYWTAPRYFWVNAPPATAPIITAPSDGSLVTQTSVLLKWNPVSNATSYQVQVVNENTGIPSGVGTAKTYYSFTGTNDTHYRFRIRAGNCVGFGPWSDWSTFYILLPPATPQVIYPTDGKTFTKTNHIRLVWQRVPTASYYEVIVENADTGYEVRRYTTEGNSVIFKGSFNCRYLWKIRAVNKAGTSSWVSRYFEIIDNTPPLISVNYSAITNKSQMRITGVITDTGSGINTAWFNGKQLVLTSNGKFSITVNLLLGNNKFVVEARDNAGNRAQKKIISVFYDNIPPTLFISRPLPSSIYSNAIKVVENVKIEGTVTDNYKVKQLLINNEVVPFDAEGEFSYQTNLHYGPNAIHIKVIDYAGNTTTRELLVSKVMNRKKIIFQINNPNMVVETVNEEGNIESKLQPIDPGRGTTPLIYHGRTFIPIRAFVQVIGGKVYWNGTERKVTIILPSRSTRIELWIGKSKARITDSQGSRWVQIEKGDSSVKPFIRNERSYFPLRFILENFQIPPDSIQWNPVLRSVTILWPIYPSLP